MVTTYLGYNLLGVLLTRKCCWVKEVVLEISRDARKS